MLRDERAVLTRVRSAERIFVRPSPRSEFDSMIGADDAARSGLALLYRHIKGVNNQL